MRQVCTRCICALQPTIRTVGTRRLLSTTLARYGNEGTSPKAKALEVYQVPKSNIPGRTLLTQAGQDDLREKPKILLWLAMKLFRTRPIRKATQGSKTKGVMREYYALCATRATSDGDEASVGFWYDELGLQPSFATWFQVTALHVYMLHARLRCYAPEKTQMYQQMLTDAFFEDIEMRIYYEYNIKSQRYIQRQMKEFFENFRGLTLAYDEGVTKSDAVLAAAFWRNLYQTSTNSVDFEKIAKIVNYFWKNMKLLDMTGQQAFSTGEFGFLSPDRTPPGMEWQPHYEDLAAMIKNIQIREKQWAEDRKADMEAIGWDFSKPVTPYAGELPTMEDQAWDKERLSLGFTSFPAIPPPQDADEILAEEFAATSSKAKSQRSSAGKKAQFGVNDV